MLDFIGATLAATAISSNKTLISMGINAVTSAAKSHWNSAILGAYALIGPYIHTDYPSRKEIMQYVGTAINQAFTMHHLSNMHSAPQFSIGPGSTTVPPDGTIISNFLYPVDSVINKKGRPVSTGVSAINVAGGDNLPDIELGTFQFEAVSVSLSPTTASILPLLNT